MGGGNLLKLVFNIHTPLFPTVNSVTKTTILGGAFAPPTHKLCLWW